MTSIPDNLKPQLVELLLSVADDKLMLGHRNSDWTGLAPILEEDIAFSSLAQDEMAHAQALYEMAGGLIGRSADDLAFGRNAEEYRCTAIVEVPDEFDWATAICRQFFCDQFDHLRLNRLARSNYKPLADLASRLAAEEQVHVEHVNSWMIRLGQGTDDSRQRMQKAIDGLAPLATLLFEPVDGQSELESHGLFPPTDVDMFEKWEARLLAVTDQGGLTLNLKPPADDARGGRRGRPSDHRATLLDEMCEVYRLDPGVKW